MLKSVNAGMREVQDGHIVIMQDDIVLECADIERQVAELYKEYEYRIGVISLRYGSDITYTNIGESIRERTWHRMIKETNFIKGPDDDAKFKLGKYGKFYKKMNAINGPNIVSNHLFRKIGLLDENLAPFGYDDPEYCLRSLQAGFINGLFPLKYRSDPEWGGTRRSKSFEKIRRQIHKRNRIYVFEKHKKFLLSQEQTFKQGNGDDQEIN
jgi:GT2 family glycosyltransferase